MGLLRMIFGDSDDNNQPDDDDKMFSDQQIKCLNSEDVKALKRLYKALYEENYDTFDDFNMKEALSSLDANVYNLAKAIIYQNFLLQRRVELLADKIDALMNNGNKA